MVAFENANDPDCVKCLECADCNKIKVNFDLGNVVLPFKTTPKVMRKNH